MTYLTQIAEDYSHSELLIRLPGYCPSMFSQVLWIFIYFIMIFSFVLLLCPLSLHFAGFWKDFLFVLPSVTCSLHMWFHVLQFSLMWVLGDHKLVIIVASLSSSACLLRCRRCAPCCEKGNEVKGRGMQYIFEEPVLSY